LGLFSSEMIQFPIYMDNNSTTRCDPGVVETMLPIFSIHYGNAASRVHIPGRLAEDVVKQSREQVAALIGAEQGEIVFTSGATEAVNLALKGATEMYASKGNHIITTNIEHKAVLDTCAYLETKGIEVTYLPVNGNGLISAADVEQAIRPDTILISVMYANNEIGTIMPINEIGQIAKKHSVLFFTDATQAVGKIEVNVNRENIDILSFSAHKMYGPKGVGALYIRRKNPRVRLVPQIHGGGHEKGLRSGTLNVPAIAGFGKASAIALEELDESYKKISRLRDKLEKALLKIPGTALNGDLVNRLPHVSNISFDYVESSALMMAMNSQLAVASGSACTSATMEPSYVLKALGLTDDRAHGSLRFSLGRFNTEDEVDFVIGLVSETVIRLRELNPTWNTLKGGDLETPLYQGGVNK
jgi:cysteine desulfurase